MRATVTSKAPERRLVAVLGDLGRGLFVRSTLDSPSIYIDENGRAFSESKTLEQLLQTPGCRREAVYEGDEVKLIF